VKQTLRSFLAALLLLAGCAELDPATGTREDGGGGKADDRARGARATLVVHYPAGWGHQIAVRGSGAGLDWGRGQAARWTEDDAWVLDLSLETPVELKALHDDRTWSRGPNYVLAPGQTLHVWPRFFSDRGRLERRAGVGSGYLAQPRDVTIYLPPSYDENWRARYPVVYMHDGQNLFEAKNAFGGVSWDVPGAMDRGAGDGSVREAIIVGIGNTRERIHEYTPTDGGYGGGGADDYLAFIALELKPLIDRDYRTLPGREQTGLVGSSLGGLVSLWGGISRADDFGLIGALSPSTWWDGTWILEQVRSSERLPVRVYVDSGNSGASQDDAANTALLAQAYRDRGAELGYVLQAGASHNEFWWRQRLPGALAFLLGPR
jgi:predicted alpha/beta superfamily hydrolase